MLKVSLNNRGLSHVPYCPVLPDLGDTIRFISQVLVQSTPIIQSHSPRMKIAYRPQSKDSNFDSNIA